MQERLERTKTMTVNRTTRLRGLPAVKDGNTVAWRERGACDLELDQHGEAQAESKGDPRNK